MANSSSIMNRDVGTIRFRLSSKTEREREFKAREQFERTCKVNTMGENSSFIFICYLKTVPVYDFRLV